MSNENGLAFDVEPPTIMFSDFAVLLRHMVDMGASDLQMTPGYPAKVEYHGELVSIMRRVLTTEDTKNILAVIGGGDKLPIVLGGQPFSASYEISTTDDTHRSSGSYRFRVEAAGCEFFGMGAIRLTLRYLPDNIPSLDDQNPPLPDDLKKAMMPHQGLVLAIGTTGSGKSTLLAGALREIGYTRPEMILTFEEPIEFVYNPVLLDSAERRWQATISQSEIGRHFKSWNSGLKSALRSAPKTMLVGEMRDKESITASIEFVRTGHALLSTMHVDGVAAVPAEIVSRTDGDEGMAGRLINVLSAAVYQKLCMRADGKGRLAIREYLIFNDDVVSYLQGATAQDIESNITGLMKDMGTDLKSMARQSVQDELINKKEYLRIIGEVYS